MSSWTNGNLQGSLSIGQGERGKSLEYEWRGTELGIRVEGEEYQFVNLAGGGTGREIELQVGNGYLQWRYKDEEEWNNLISIDSLKGGNGKSLEYNWNGTELGIKREGDDSYSYVNLKGKDGRDGVDGVDGVTPNIKIGTVTTLEPGEKATVVNSGTRENPVFDFGIPKGNDGVGGTGGTGEKLIFNYTHNSNKVIQPISLDFSTGVFTCAEAHELKNGDRLLLDFTPVKGEYFNQTKILKELFDFNWATWYFMVVEVVSDTEFKIKNNVNNTYLTYKESNTPNLDFNAFRFQLANQIVLSNLGLSKYRKLKFKLNLLTIGQEYCNTINVLKLSNENHPLKQTGIKFKEWYSPASLLYPNMSMDANINTTYGHSAKFRNDLIENVITIQEDKVLRSAKMTSVGFSGTFTAHDNNVIARNYIFDNVFEDVGYENGNVFLNTITIPLALKNLNGSVVEIYSLEG